MQNQKDEAVGNKKDDVLVSGNEVQEVLQKEVFVVSDIEILFQCKKNVAYRIMKGIKDYSDRLKLAGRIHKKDYLDYINRQL